MIEHLHHTLALVVIITYSPEYCPNVTAKASSDADDVRWLLT
jgi:hypothetical protein